MGLTHVKQQTLEMRGKKNEDEEDIIVSYVVFFLRLFASLAGKWERKKNPGR